MFVQNHNSNHCLLKFMNERQQGHEGKDGNLSLQHCEVPDYTGYKA